MINLLTAKRGLDPARRGMVLMYREGLHGLDVSIDEIQQPARGHRCRA